jgi:hypothetical protein
MFFARLPPHVKPGDTVKLPNGEIGKVLTAKLADDLQDAKCTLRVEGRP